MLEFTAEAIVDEAKDEPSIEDPAEEGNAESNLEGTLTLCRLHVDTDIAQPKTSQEAMMTPLRLSLLMRNHQRKTHL